MAVLNRFNVLGTLEGPVNLWDPFKRKTLEAAQEGRHWRVLRIKESPAARFIGSTVQYQDRGLSY